MYGDHAHTAHTIVAISAWPVAFALLPHIHRSTSTHDKNNFLYHFDIYLNRFLCKRQPLQQSAQHIED